MAKLPYSLALENGFSVGQSRSTAAKADLGMNLVIATTERQKERFCD